MQNTNSSTIRLNVGGTSYEVSRSTIEKYPDTMLARMISESWSSDDSGDESDKDKKALFIDRDGERFRYVLDYMRDGSDVSLPVLVSKEGFLKDLEYFGFENVNPTNVFSSSNYAQIVQKMNGLDDDHGFALLAHYCFTRFKVSCGLRISIVHDPSDVAFSQRNTTKYKSNKVITELQATSLSLSKGFSPMWEQNRDCFNKHLSKYGLHVVFSSYERNDIVNLKIIDN